MIFAVYFMTEYDDDPVIVATFLMKSDAERFIKSSPYSTGYTIIEIKRGNKLIIEIKESLESV